MVHQEISYANAALYMAYAAHLSNQTDSAMNWARTAANSCRRLYGKGNRSTIFAQRIFAACNIAKGRYAKGAQQLEECLKTFRENYPDTDPDQDIATHSIRSILTNVREKLHDDTADPEKDLEENLEKHGWHDHTTIMSANALASKLNRTGRYEEAVETAEKAYEAAVSLMGEKDGSAILLKNNLSRYLFDAGRKEEALRMAEECLKTASEEYGEDSLTAADILANTGYFKNAEGRYEEALMDYTKALELYGLNGSADRTKRAALLNNTGAVQWNLSRYEDAYDTYRQAYELFAETAGTDSMPCLFCLSMQGACLQETGEPDQARKLCEESWQKAIAEGEKLTRETYQIAMNLAAVYQKQETVSGAAEQLYRYLAEYSRTVLHDQQKAAQFEKLAKEVRRNLRS
jgi:tetratricopeptide (TPR) repeat protein